MGPVEEPGMVTSYFQAIKARVGPGLQFPTTQLDLPGTVDETTILQLYIALQNMKTFKNQAKKTLRLLVTLLL